jgi:hypothetical protein
MLDGVVIHPDFGEDILDSQKGKLFLSSNKLFIPPPPPSNLIGHFGPGNPRNYV